MSIESFYERPMVRRLLEIFGDPQPPSTITEEQFHECQDALASLAKMKWHEVERGEYGEYLQDLAYVPLQQDLFDYLFPAILILWWEGQLNRTGGPFGGGSDFYSALDSGQALVRMLAEGRRGLVLSWMVDAYSQGVDEWSGKLSVDPREVGNDLHGPLWSFHAIGQSLPLIPQIWQELSRIVTPGRAQWWLVLCVGLTYPANQAPFIPPWTKSRGGGGVYVLESEASIYDHGYLTSNLEFIRAACTPQNLIERLEQCEDVLTTDFDREYCELTLARIHADPGRFARRIAAFLSFLSEPNLGGVESIDD